MKQSIVIPTAGSAEYLYQTLGSLLPALLEDRLIDVVVVENGPQSGTEVIVGHFRQAIERSLARRVRYVHEPIPGLLAGRHRGVFETDGDIISFFDDDVIVSRSLHSALRTAFSDSSVKLVGGPARPMFLDIPPDWFMSLAEKNDQSGFMMTFMSLIDLREEIISDVNPNFVWGQNFHIRRETFLELRGFHPDIVPREMARFQGDGETGLTTKFGATGMRADYLDGVAIRHILPSSRLTVNFVKKRAFYAGVCQAFTMLRDSGMPSDASSDPELTRSPPSVFRRVKNRSVVSRKRGQSLKSAIAQEKQQGKVFLINEYKKSATVKTWLHQTDFMDYAFPDVTD